MTTHQLDSNTPHELHLLLEQELQLNVILAMLADETLIFDSEITDADYPILLEG